MDRRQFLQLSAMLSAGAVTAAGCAKLTPRYTRPERLTRPEESLLLRDVRLVDVTAGRVQPRKELLLEKGRIRAIGPLPGGQTLPADRTLDVGGAYLLPGLINAHCHMSLPGGIGFGPGFVLAYRRQLERNAEECIKHGVTTVRDMLAIWNFLHEIESKIARGEILGPRIVSCCAIDVPGSYGAEAALLTHEPHWRTVRNPEEGRLAARAAFDEGAAFLKLFQQPTELVLPGDPLPVMDTATVAAICEEAARAGRPVALHHTTASGLERGLAGGVTTLEHMTTDRLLTDEEVARVREGGHAVVPTASIAFSLAFEKPGDPNWGKGFTTRIARERAQLLPEILQEFCEPELVPSTLKLFRNLSDPRSFDRWHLFPWPDPATMNAAASLGAVNTERLRAAGLPFGCGNDGGVPFVFPGALGIEMALLEEQGTPPAELVRMATADNARILGLSEEIGTVEPGKIADLALFEENPLLTARNLLRPRMVFQAGQLVYAA